MYDFHQNFIKKNFDAELLSTDTDSLTYEIKLENDYEEFFSGKICLTLVTIQKTGKLTKYLCHAFTIKDMCQMMEFLRWLILIKIVSQVVNRFKKIVIKKVVKRLKKIVIKKVIIKKIVIKEKYCDN